MLQNVELLVRIVIASVDLATWLRYSMNEQMLMLLLLCLIAAVFIRTIGIFTILLTLILFAVVYCIYY